MAGESEALARVLEVGRLLSSTLELGPLLKAVLELSARVVEAETASVLLLDEKTDELYFDVALGLPGQASSLRLKLGQGVAGSVALERKPVIINDVRADPRWSAAADEKSGFSTRSILAVPMTVKGKLLGVIEAINKKSGAFGFDDLRALEAFASQAAVAIENARLFASLEAERFKLQTVFEETADGVILAEAKGKIVLANAAARKLMGRADAGTVEQALEGLAVTPPLEELLAAPGAHRDFTAARELPKKLVLAGKITKLDSGWLCVFRDETEQWQKERLKRTFLSLISHKLKTPLAAVTGFSDILLLELDRQPEPPAPAVLKAAKTIAAQGAKLADLIDKLLRYTHLEGSEDKAERARCDLGEIAGEAVKEMGPWLSERQAAVELSREPGAVVLGDREQLGEVVKNLVENAAKFDPKPEKRVLVRVARADGGAELSVQDSGRGIPPEDQERVFSQFHQIEQFFTGQVDGWGLGLPYVRKVVRAHGGEVSLESRLGLGTTVTCRFPGEAAA